MKKIGNPAGCCCNGVCLPFGLPSATTLSATIYYNRVAGVTPTEGYYETSETLTLNRVTSTNTGLALSSVPGAVVASGATVFRSACFSTPYGFNSSIQGGFFRGFKPPYTYVPASFWSFRLELICGNGWTQILLYKILNLGPDVMSPWCDMYPNNLPWAGTSDPPSGLYRTWSASGTTSWTVVGSRGVLSPWATNESAANSSEAVNCFQDYGILNSRLRWYDAAALSSVTNPFYVLTSSNSAPFQMIFDRRACPYGFPSTWGSELFRRITITDPIGGAS